ncbi:MAG: hypothetical protein Q7K16_03550 [Candidatus Azambacteria bacterium]|nr:hypothetical protein [Candidatus Azambacteria bacterium]
MTGEEITKLFWESVKDNIDFKESADLVKKNSNGGGVWLIGGFLYQNIAVQLYGLEEQKAKDIDFIVENPADKIAFPNNWKEKTTSYNNPKFIRNDGLIVDLVPLKEVNSIVRRNLPAIIENYLTGVPLNIQSIVFDINNNRVFGDIGIKALLDKTVAINNLEEAMVTSEHKKKPIQQIIKEKAEALGFLPLF